MLPPSLGSAYRQYKEDTNFVASWLASTARGCGYPAHLLSPPGTAGTAAPPQAPPKRLKGKSRKEAQKAKNAPQPKSPPKYAVAADNFVPLAEYIASSKPPVSVPLSFVTSINRVIKIRSAFGSLMAQHELVGAPDPESERRHSYFVGILERVREVLKARMPATTAPAEPTPESGDAPRGLANAFAGLRVYDPAEVPDPSPLGQPPAQPTGSGDVVYEAESQVSLGDALMAYSMMVSDLERIRSTISWIWGNYQNGTFDVASAAISTNAAIDLAKNVIEEVVSTFKDIWDECISNIMGTHLAICCMDRGYSIHDCVSPGREKHNAYDVEDEMYSVAFAMIASFGEGLKTGGLPLYNGYLGWYDPRRDRATMTGAEKHSEDKVVLAEICSELMVVNWVAWDYIVQDEFVLGLDEMNRTGKVPFHLVFSAQVFLDIHHILRSDAERPFDQMIKEVRYMGDTIDAYLDFHKDIKNPQWGTSNDDRARLVRKKMREVENDPVYRAKVKLWEEERLSAAPATWVPNRILRSSPVLSGLMLYHFRAHMYELGIGVANAWESITYTWHIYNALCLEKLTRRVWMDMCAAEAIIGEENFHVGSTATGRHKAFIQCHLQLGFTSATFAPNRRRNFNMLSKAGQRQIKHGATVTRMFRNHYLPGMKRFDWTVEHLDAIVSSSGYDIQESQDGHFFMSRRSKAGEKAKKQPADRPLQPETVIVSLMQALQAERAEFTFPFFHMHEACWRVLQEIKLACDDVLREKWGVGYNVEGWLLSGVVWYILAIACGWPTGASDTQVADTRPLRAAIKPINDVMTRPSVIVAFAAATGIKNRVVEGVYDGVLLKGRSFLSRGSAGSGGRVVLDRSAPSSSVVGSTPTATVVSLGHTLFILGCE